MLTPQVPAPANESVTGVRAPDASLRATFVPTWPSTLLKLVWGMTPDSSVGSMAVGAPPKLPPVKLTPMYWMTACAGDAKAKPATAADNNAAVLDERIFTDHSPLSQRTQR